MELIVKYEIPDDIEAFKDWLQEVSILDLEFYLDMMESAEAYEHCQIIKEQIDEINN